jgi:uncharacterized delta-60 repeat protein
LHHRRTITGLGAAIVLLAAIAPATAGGALDTTFSGDGVVVKDLSGTGSSDEATAVAVQSDGKIVTAGRVYTNGRFVGIAARYTTAGKLDGTFHGTGSVELDLSTIETQLTGVAVDPSTGSIFVGGNYYSAATNSEDFVVAKFTSGGSTDTSFGGGDGVVVTDLGGDDLAFALAVGPDGTILLAGTDGSDFAVARYTSVGAPDPAFNSTGVVRTDFFGMEDVADGLAVTGPSGKVVVGGYAKTATGHAFAIARYTSAGAPDTTFSGDGKVTARFGSVDNQGQSLALDAKGRILIARTTQGPANLDFAVGRFLRSGAPDTAFSGDGKTTVSVGPDDYCWSLGIQSNGKILLAGATYGSGSWRVALARFTVAGDPDSRFSGDGRLISDLTPGRSSGAFDVSFEPGTGNIVIAGDGNGAPGTPDQLVARYLA